MITEKHFDAPGVANKVIEVAKRSVQHPYFIIIDIHLVPVIICLTTPLCYRRTQIKNLSDAKKQKLIDALLYAQFSRDATEVTVLLKQY